MRSIWDRKKWVARKKPIAVVTMAYNEIDMLPFWLMHYKNQVGLDNCYIIDHGTTDGSTDNVGCKTTQFRRSPFDETARASLVSGYCAMLLESYDAVLYTDADEMVMADPAIAISLTKFIVDRETPDVGFVLGMDVVHDASEARLKAGVNVLMQRQWARATHSLCKPTLIRRPYQWSPGFHLTSDEPTFCGLYLFHLAYADDEIIRRRQAKRNSAPPVIGGDHHRLLPEEIAQLLKSHTPMENKREVNLGSCSVEKEFIESIKPHSTLQLNEIWRIPDRFKK